MNFYFAFSALSEAFIFGLILLLLPQRGRSGTSNIFKHQIFHFIIITFPIKGSRSPLLQNLLLACRLKSPPLGDLLAAGRFRGPPVLSTCLKNYTAVQSLFYKNPKACSLHQLLLCHWQQAFPSSMYIYPFRLF
jgi:hypothetical protein